MTLILDDDQTRLAWFQSRIPGARVTGNARDCIRMLADSPVARLFLDRHLGKDNGSGDDVIEYLREHAADFPELRVVVHSNDHQGANFMCEQLEGLISCEAAAFGTERLREETE